MKRKALISFALATALSLPASAAAPPFETPAPVAFMKDLSSGAILYAKDADRRMPPASRPASCPTGFWPACATAACARPQHPRGCAVAPVLRARRPYFAASYPEITL